MKGLKCRNTTSSHWYQEIIGSEPTKFGRTTLHVVEGGKETLAKLLLIGMIHWWRLRGVEGDGRGCNAVYLNLGVVFASLLLYMVVTVVVRSFLRSLTGMHRVGFVFSLPRELLPTDSEVLAETLGETDFSSSSSLSTFRDFFLFFFNVSTTWLLETLDGFAEGLWDAATGIELEADNELLELDKLIDGLDEVPGEPTDEGNGGGNTEEEDELETSRGSGPSGAKKLAVAGEKALVGYMFPGFLLASSSLTTAEEEGDFFWSEPEVELAFTWRSEAAWVLLEEEEEVEGPGWLPWCKTDGDSRWGNFWSANCMSPSIPPVLSSFNNTKDSNSCTSRSCLAKSTPGTTVRRRHRRSRNKRRGT
jgi:hypothetical protein